MFAIWLAVILACGVGYWLIDLSGSIGLVETGARVRSNLGGLLTAIYFSFITATSVGYGDVLPVGATRILAVTEAVAGLLIFGLLIAKFVSYRQDMLVREIHSVTFEGRLDRVRTNLHLVVSELLAIAAICDDGAALVERLGPRLETTTLVFTGELRTVHKLLYNPQQAPDEPVLDAILANLASALNTLHEVLLCLPSNLRKSPVLEAGLRTLSALANDICADCVPQVYAPALTMWMDRIQQAARTII
jgi:Ion channel